MSNTPEPVWKRPAWITAMVGVISIFFTVPEILGDYLTKQQDIELAKEKTKSVELQNKESKQDQEFKIINNTLAQLDTERVFLLRYLAATLDDPEARVWAKAEVDRLDDLATRKDEIVKARKDIEKKELELQARIKQGEQGSAELESELIKLRSALEDKDSKVEELRQNAGLSNEQNTGNIVTAITIDFGRQNEKDLPETFVVEVEMPGIPLRRMLCNPDMIDCSSAFDSDFSGGGHVLIRDLDSVKSITGVSYVPRFLRRFTRGVWPITFNCIKESPNLRCLPIL